MKSEKNEYVSLLETLSFLEHIGAGDPTHESALQKSDLSLTSPKNMAQNVLQHLESRADQNVSIKDGEIHDHDHVKGDDQTHATKHTYDQQKHKKLISSGSMNKNPVNTDQVHKVHLQLNALDKQRVSPLQKQSDIVQKAQNLAASAQSVEELQDIIHNFEGCPLKLTATNTVFADGNPDADIMLVGEAPGADEDRFGKPFVGRSGQLLDKMMAAIQLNRKHDYYITNIIPWRPPGNRPPTPEETAICLPFVQRHIQLKYPKYLICIGGTAAKALLSTKETMGRLRGKWFDYEVNPSLRSDNTGRETSQRDQNFYIPTTVIFHPSYLLRSPGQKKMAWEDLQKLESYFLKT